MKWATQSCGCGQKRGGSALLIVLWALIILAAAVFAWTSSLYQSIELMGEANAGLEATAAAHAGIAMARNEAVKKSSQELLAREIVPGYSRYEVTMVSEGGRLDINWLITDELSGAVPNSPRTELLRRWLEQKGLGFEERQKFIDCLADYLDADSEHRLNGAEEEPDYHAPQPGRGKLFSLDELALVKGAEPLLAAPGWREELTVHTNAPIDLLAASADVLRLIPGLDAARIQRFLDFRAGRDHIDGTADDPEFKDMGQVYNFLGLVSQQQTQMLGAITAINNPIMHITAKGYAGKVIRQVEVVARKGGNPQILSWQE